MELFFGEAHHNSKQKLNAENFIPILCLSF